MKYGGKRVFIASSDKTLENEFRRTYIDKTITTINESYFNKRDRLRDIVNKIADCEFVVVHGRDRLIEMLALELGKQIVIYK